MLKPWCSPAMNQPYPLTKEQVRLLLLYDFRIKKKAANSIADINTAFGPDTVSKSTAYDWYSRFQKGNESLEDQPRTGRPSEMACQCLEHLLSLTPKEKESLQSKVLPDESIRKEILLKTLHSSPSGFQKGDTLVESVVVEGISIHQHFKKDERKLELLGMVLVPSCQKALQGLALSVASSSPALLSGPVGCGKTSLLQYLAACAGMEVLSVQLSEETDSKLLLGTYQATNVPGKFVWTMGILTKAVVEGRWLILEDVDRASSDVHATLRKLLESRTLTLPGIGDSILASPRFRLFATQRGGSLSMQTLSPSWMTIQQLWNKVSLEVASRDELGVIVAKRWPVLGLIIEKILDVFELVSKENPLKWRPVSLRDLTKWCDRVARDFDPASTACNLKAFQDSLQCFCFSIPDIDKRVEMAEQVGSFFNILKEMANFYCLKHKPDVHWTRERLCIGRAILPISKDLGSQARSWKFSMTQKAALLLESLGVVVLEVEPVLLVGETGVGKTAAIQFLAHQLGHPLHIINMNQQSDVADLLGGYKPVEVRHIIRPLKEDFERLFAATFSLAQNEKFLSHVAASFMNGRWKDLLTLMAHSQVGALTKLTGSKNEHLSREWRELGAQIQEVREQLSHLGSSLAFSFVEGSLVRALKQGEWILLDELNLATPETLDCLSGILEAGPNGSTILLEKGDTEPLKKHPNFRLFACMNPATDVGKKELPLGIRNRFTEIFVDELVDPVDLKLLVGDYLRNLGLTMQQIEGVVSFYLSIRQEVAQRLVDGTGHRPHYSLRTLCRSLRVARSNPCGSVARSLFEAFCLGFLTQLDSQSQVCVENMITKHILGKKNVKGTLGKAIPHPSDSTSKYIQVEGYWIPQGATELLCPRDYILTKTVRGNLKRLARIVSLGHLPVLLQGETSVGKTSLISYLAKITGNVCIRINNHEHTDIQEYIGSYVSDETGKLVFCDGALVKALRRGDWIILDELNLAPTEVLEALNRLLDDNHELFVPETQETVKAHPRFLLFATQNPPGLYGGRKVLSRAFRNRFIELHFGEIPSTELEVILHQRCSLPQSYCKKLINIMHELQLVRRGSGVFCGKAGFMTLRDLFRWAERYRLADDPGSTFFDWDQLLADEGYLLLAGRMRRAEEAETIAQVLQKHFKRTVDPSRLFSYSEMTSPVTKPILEMLQQKQFPAFGHIVWTYQSRRLAVLTAQALKYKEPVLLVGGTGCGKTTIVQYLATVTAHHLHSINCHMHSESADFIGGLRPVRSHHPGDDRLFEWAEGPLVKAMKDGCYFLVDEISLADDSVLERLNSVLEPERRLLISEKATDGIGGEAESLMAKEGFRIIGTMNPGGDFGKKELSPALRNRFTEIWAEEIREHNDLMAIIEHNVKKGISFGNQEDGSTGFGSAMMDFLCHLQSSPLGTRYTVSVRDILSWVNFVNIYMGVGDKSIALAYVHGACLVFIDALGSGNTASMRTEEIAIQREDWLAFLNNQVMDRIGVSVDISAKQELMSSPCLFGYPSFCIDRGPRGEKSLAGWYTLQAPTPCQNTLRVLRAMQLRKPILLEGSPGVGKTSLVTALAQASGWDVVRINLSEQTDISDLFGADLPVEGGRPGDFAWKDGPLLLALKESKWILLDEEGKLKKGEISTKYDIPPLTLSSIVGTKEKIRKEFFNASFAPGRKKLRGAKYGDIEEALFEWFQQVRAYNIALDGNTIWQKAAELAKVLGIENFECSSGWLSRFKDRHGIVFKKCADSHVYLSTAGFCHGESTQEETDVAPPMESDDAWEEIASQLQVGCEFTQFVNIDEDVPTCEPLPNPAMCAEAHGVMELEDAANEQELEEQPAYPSHGMLWKHDQVIVAALETHEGSCVLCMKGIIKYLNLASQSVLEGLNACLDHRGEIYIPELGQTFHIPSSGAASRIFACQNPLPQGGARKGLPQSFLNRFTQVYMEPLSHADLKFIACAMFPSIDSSVVEKLIEFNMRIASHFPAHGEFNLRDVFRWCQLILHQGGIHPGSFVPLLYLARFQNQMAKKEVCRIYQEVFETDDDRELQFSGQFLISPYLVQIGLGTMERGHGSSKEFPPKLRIIQSQMESLQHLLTCVHMNWMPILMGGSGSGKTALVQLTAALAGKRLRFMALTPSMDATELLGGFEQADLSLSLHVTVESLEEKVNEYLRQAILGDSRSSMDQVMEKWEHLQHLLSDTGRWSEKREKKDEVQAFVEKCNAALAMCDCLPNSHHSLRSQILAIRDQAAREDSISGGGRFSWVDSILVKALERGDWLLLDNVNLCSPSLLDRLNGLLEPQGCLTLNEKGLEKDGSLRSISPHPDFRIFLTLDPKNGEISRAMRNRGVEIWLQNPSIEDEDFSVLMVDHGLSNSSQQAVLFWIVSHISALLPSDVRPSMRDLLHAATLTFDQLAHGISFSDALHFSSHSVFIDNLPVSEWRHQAAHLVEEAISCQFEDETYSMKNPHSLVSLREAITDPNLCQSLHLLSVVEDFANTPHTSRAIRLVLSQSSPASLFLLHSLILDIIPSELRDLVSQLCQSLHMHHSQTNWIPFDVRWNSLLPVDHQQTVEDKKERGNRVQMSLSIAEFLTHLNWKEKLEFQKPKKKKERKIEKWSIWDMALTYNAGHTPAEVITHKSLFHLIPTLSQLILSLEHVSQQPFQDCTDDIANHLSLGLHWLRHLIESAHRSCSEQDSLDEALSILALHWYWVSKHLLQDLQLLLVKWEKSELRLWPIHVVDAHRSNYQKKLTFLSSQQGSLLVHQFISCKDIQGLNLIKEEWKKLNEEENQGEGYCMYQSQLLPLACLLVLRNCQNFPRKDLNQWFEFLMLALTSPATHQANAWLNSDLCTLPDDLVNLGMHSGILTYSLLQVLAGLPNNPKEELHTVIPVPLGQSELKLKQVQAISYSLWAHSDLLSQSPLLLELNCLERRMRSVLAAYCEVQGMGDVCCEDLSSALRHLSQVLPGEELICRLSRNMEALQESPSWEEMGGAWVCLGALQVQLSTCLSHIDPVEKTRLKKSYLIIQLENLEGDLLVLQHQWKHSRGVQLNNVHPQHMHPYVSFLHRMISRLQTQIQKCSQALPVRPLPSRFAALKKDLRQYTESIGKSKVLLSLLDAIHLKQVDGGTLAKRLQAQEKAMLAFIEKLEEKYLWYQDLVLVPMVAIAECIYGLKLLSHVVAEQQLGDNFSQCSSKVAFHLFGSSEAFLDLIPTMDQLMNRLNILEWKRDLIKILCLKAELKHECVTKAIQGSRHGKQGWETLLDLVVGLWKAQEEQQIREDAEREAAYLYK
ncbi:unnamed protein product [Darwinula stevensoni]|uniref:Midasin n=1 Tax=Darwinula stevensoni TaxID=69355 RepID=A0A7R8X7W9_9CRUS|nr:unnamed protein product [Darwinula stevensoni]CAG0889502.1 unnamed protein product [Darwinula stevensoni]